ncbi:CYFA0S01e01354g1_1 [Cyberlindnera fabianii]|uniref:CYFA0S01e01354g1_1 n=1 Tax=Cyberlindnera fabianii TaxID=36022 RepID=A0A061AP16_CYBFA|nr:Glucose starvation modulator protein 1 [Cyberlindnera fabianii]CDR36424.1 CYFA0S01e01354g1_1 [Cyberlindnera fabianii]
MEEKLVPMKDQNALVMGNGKVFKIQKVRQRKIHSCVPCHQRKVKCSREHPVCQNCTKNDLECKYFVNDRVSRGKKNKDLDKELEQKKKQELKAYIEKAKTLSTGSSISPPPEGLAMAQEQLNKIKKSSPAMTQHQIQPRPVSSHSHSQSPYQDIPSSSSSSHIRSHSDSQSINSNPSPPAAQMAPVQTYGSGQVPIHILPDSGSEHGAESPKEKSLTFSDSDSSASNESLSPPKLHNPQLLPTEKPRGSTVQSPYDPMGQNLNNAILSDFTVRQTPQAAVPPRTQLVEAFSNGFSNTNSTSQPLNLQSQTVPVILLRKPHVIPNWKLEEIYSALPSKERSYGLVQRYTTSIHPVLPLLDINEFIEEHDAFWENTVDNKMEFIVLLYAVLYAASKAECFEFSYDEITKFELSNEIHKYLRVARSALQAIKFPYKYSLRVLQAAVIIHSTLENPHLVDVGELVRIAQSINLDRDPATFHNISDPALVQLRRLLWWEIFYLDCMTALKQMSTPLIRLEEFDTSLPVEYVNNVLHTGTCFLNGKFRYALILNELTRFIYGIQILPFNTIQVLKQKILDLHISCNASIMNLENVEKSRKLTYEEKTFIDWAKYMLSGYCDRAVLLLQKKIVLSNVLNTNEDGNNQIFHNSYNQMVNNKRSKFSIDTLFRSSDSNYLNPDAHLTHYSYDDLSNNLIPAALHYLYEFLKNNNDDIYNRFNWEIRNNLPFDAIILVLTNLISDLEKNGHDSRSYELRNDVRYHLLDKAIDLIFIKFDNKKRSIIKNCFTLIRYLFQILRLKYLRNDTQNTLIDFNSLYTEQVIPKPLNSRVSSDARNETSQPKPTNDGFFPPMQTTSCAQIAPRAIRAVAGNTQSISFAQQQFNPLNSVSLSDMFVNGLTSEFYQTGVSSGANTDNTVDDGYKEHELQRIKSQITKFLREERLPDDDRFNNKFYTLIENEVKELIERLI